MTSAQLNPRGLLDGAPVSVDRTAEIQPPDLEVRRPVALPWRLLTVAVTR